MYHGHPGLQRDTQKTAPGTQQKDPTQGSFSKPNCAKLKTPEDEAPSITFGAPFSIQNTAISIFQNKGEIKGIYWPG
jgi:hypothetical protein